LLTDQRTSKIEDLVRNRQLDFTIILDNVHDPHNLGAIIRTCDAAGIREVHVIYHSNGVNSNLKYIGKRASRGASKWVDVFFYNDVESCISKLKERGFVILATHLYENAKSIYSTDFTKPCAIVFGNERDGISQKLLSVCDGNIVIPMYGMVQSLNVSNAAAIILFEMVRQRSSAALFEKPLNVDSPEVVNLFNDYISRSLQRITNKDRSIVDGFVDKIINSKKEEE
jgi:tRNA (guanosine-2'-O-)-methyltransferase